LYFIYNISAPTEIYLNSHGIIRNDSLNALLNE